MELAGKKIAILGAGGSGFAAAALARHRGAEVAAFDNGDPSKLTATTARFADLGVTLTCGAAALNAPHHFDLTVLSPGIDRVWPIARAFDESSDELIGEIEFAWRMGSSPVIAITGTNGKTTTTGLVAEMLRGAGLSTIAAGNIGLPYSEVVLSGKDYDWIVLEVSSFQLETIVDFAPRVAVWLNFAPDHMDRYTTVEDYHAAKFRIFENLGDEGLAICKLESNPAPGARAVTFSAFCQDADFSYGSGEIVHRASGRRFPFSSGRLQGKHNAENVMAALAIADELGLDWNVVRKAILGFAPPPHRCEKVAVVDGITFLNDSKSTNLHSLESALAGQEDPVVLIAGGKNKGLDFSELRPLAATMVREAVCIGEIAAHIESAWAGSVPCRRAESLTAAVAAARNIARPGEIVLFSPGTSSFDMFSGYEARGEAFRNAVHSLESR